MQAPSSLSSSRCLLLLAVVGAGSTAWAEAPAPVDFSRDVQPILSQHCFACHGPDESSRQAGLRLDWADAAVGELDSGARAIVPGEPEASELIARVASDDPGLRMPPESAGDALTDQQIDILRQWIAAGAVRDDHWSFRPIIRPQPPVVRDAGWVRNPIDRFVLARLEQEGVAPSPEADRTALLRRLSLDLRGLPPQPAEVDEFLGDNSPEAYERLVDRLLASPHFGERWGRHWLDLAHYADSDGYLGDALRPYAWRYRDWVIDAVNEDLPFDRFTVEQLAGDLLPDATLEQRMATGFLRNTLRNTEAGVDLEEYRLKEIVDRVSTVGIGWLGLSLGCAECHSHKFDPISHREFYELFAFFNNTDDVDVAAPLPGGPADAKAMTVARRKQDRITYVHLRGNYRSRGEDVRPGTPAVLPPLSVRGEEAGRLDLARWLVDAGNPLTPRVTANHLWKHLFGRGLVATVDNFGSAGELPSHPELLDWLACEQIERGWSRKAVIRLIVTSATYRQASHGRSDLEQRDPLNVLLARQSRLRLEAESVRDAALTASGLLERKIGGTGIRPPQPDYVASISRNVQWEVTTGADLYRRGLYILFRRATPYPMLLTFDAPDSTVACVRRERSNSPLQSLTLLNDPVFFECAQALGEALAGGVPRSLDERLSEGFRRCLGRDPREAELLRLRRLFNERRERLAANPDAARSIVASGDAPPPGEDPGSAGEASSVVDRAAWIIMARVLMNLDEFITRE
jgi:mono/diheme cytochrome c family protein